MNKIQIIVLTIIAALVSLYVAAYLFIPEVKESFTSIYNTSYEQGFRASFLSSCANDIEAREAMCQCILSGLEAKMDIKSDADELARFLKGPEGKSITRGCMDSAGQ